MLKHSMWVWRGANPLCRESEGAPMLRAISHQLMASREWRTKGVDEILDQLVAKATSLDSRSPFSRGKAARE